ncbi:MAG: polyhydroxyalkanoate synthesis repressor PhaR [Rhizobiaceae bacterium]|jgi:polyhydroxyalkanoate synthesis repressor PhaR|nr:polyhydroxyalkanoate synthesis repressor PhaR [Rhizobiaceae bacterium]
MAKAAETTTIKKYANRRLYNTGTSTYVTLEDLAGMVKRGEEFAVQDAKTGEDLTHTVLTQIIFELENKNGETMLPVPFLRQLIAFYGDQMQQVVPSYLEHTMAAFTKEQERMREQMQQLFTQTPMDVFKSGSAVKAMEAQVRRNMEMFQEAMRMMTPFGALPTAPSAEQPAETARKPQGAKPQADKGEIDILRDQIAAMQRKLDTMG